MPQTDAPILSPCGNQRQNQAEGDGLHKGKSVLWQPGGHSTLLGQLQPYDGGRSWTGRKRRRRKTMLLMSVQKGHKRKAEQWVCSFVAYFVMVDVVYLNANGRKPVQKRVKIKEVRGFWRVWSRTQEESDKRRHEWCSLSPLKKEAKEGTRASGRSWGKRRMFSESPWKMEYELDQKNKLWLKAQTTINVSFREAAVSPISSLVSLQRVGKESVRRNPSRMWVLPIPCWHCKDKGAPFCLPRNT